jgi:hypothetical protein
VLRLLALGAAGVLAACAVEPAGVDSVELTSTVKKQRYTLIRDSAAEMGMTNAALLAGIAISETGLAHCQSEATYACQGPPSPSCDGGPIIAGAADGPCTAMQGGLGMFQFDAGTYDQTLAAYGDSILTVEGNTAQAVSFVVDKVILDISGVNDWTAATGWLNAIPMKAGDPLLERWAQLMACRYNGCCSTSTTCTTRKNGYRDNALTAYSDMGAAFWKTDDRCSGLPDGGVIDQRSACYVAGGDPRYWHREAAGYGDDLEWTNTTSGAAPANFAEWILRAPAGRYRLEVAIDPAFGASKRASYEVTHAGTTETIVIDQSASSGFVSLGEFELAGTGDEHVLLGDNTGEPGSTMTKLEFDALRVTSLDGSNDGGGCASGGTPGLGLALVLLAFRRRRLS